MKDIQDTAYLKEQLGELMRFVGDHQELPPFQIENMVDSLMFKATSDLFGIANFSKAIGVIQQSRERYR